MCFRQGIYIQSSESSSHKQQSMKDKKKNEKRGYRKKLVGESVDRGEERRKREKRGVGERKRKEPERKKGQQEVNRSGREEEGRQKDDNRMVCGHLHRRISWDHLRTASQGPLLPQYILPLRSRF